MNSRRALLRNRGVYESGNTTTEPTASEGVVRNLSKHLTFITAERSLLTT